MNNSLGPKNVALIVAAGSGTRAGQEIAKQYVSINGQPMIAHSARSFADHPNIDALYIVIGQGQEQQAKDALGGITYDGLIIGGSTRQLSVFNGLQYISNKYSDENIFIHDAARPDLPHDVIDRLIKALDENRGAIPILPVSDTMVQIDDNIMHKALNREVMGRVQTPQAFRFNDLWTAHQNAAVSNYTDDAQILHAAGFDIAVVDGDPSLNKYTFAEDFMTHKPNFRIGSGYDVHRFGVGEELWLGGIKIDHHMGLIGHSDADIVLHALTDALFGALAKGDIGDHFPPSDPKWKGASSDIFMKYACDLAIDSGYKISNADVTIACEAPKIGPVREKIRHSIAQIMNIDVQQISVKATTTEKLGFTGRGEGMAVQAQILIERL